MATNTNLIRTPVYVGAGVNETYVKGDKFVPFSYDVVSGKTWLSGRELPTNVVVIYFEAGKHEFTANDRQPPTLNIVSQHLWEIDEKINKIENLSLSPEKALLLSLLVSLSVALLASVWRKARA